MSDNDRLNEDERAALGKDAGVPWQRVCPACGHYPADVGVYADEEPKEASDGTMVLADPWLACPWCGEEWQATDERYVLAQVPPADSPEMEGFVEDFLAALLATYKKPSSWTSGT